MADAALQFISDAAHHTGSDGCFGVVADVGGVSVGFNPWQAGGAVVQRFQSHFNAWRNVSSEVVSCGINKIIGDARAGINDQQVCLRFQRYSADNGCQSVGSERLRRAVGHGDWRGGGSLHFEYGVA